MTARISETDLLAYVEETLDPEAMAALREQIAGEPRMQAKLDALARDRTTLRAIGDPALPRDFISDLESRLLRPMLIENPPSGRGSGQPGAYRRRHRATSRGSRVARYAFAAVVLVVVSAALWATLNFGLAGEGDSTGNRRAGAGPGEAPAPRVPTLTDVADDALVVASDDALEPNDQVHHYGPLPRTVVAHVGGGHEPSSDQAVRLTAPLVLVLAHDDVASGEEAILRGVAGLSRPDAIDEVPAAFVQNFSMAEARMLEEKHFPGARRDPSPTAVASVGDADQAATARQRLADVLDTLRHRPAGAGNETVLESRVLIESHGAAPTYEDQLELSGRGATHTIAVRADALGELLARLHRFDEPRPVLRMLDEDGNVPMGEARAVTLDEWILERRAVDAFLAELQEAERDSALLLVPVLIESRDDER